MSVWLLPQTVKHSSWPHKQCQGTETIRKTLPKQCAFCTAWYLRETYPQHKENLGVYCFKASFCALISDEMEIIFNHILWTEKKSSRILFFWLYWSGHPLSQLIIYKKRHNFHNKAAVAAKTQIEKSKPEWLLCLVSGRLWICWAGQWQPCTPSVRHLFHISMSMYIYAVPPSCLCSSMPPFLTPPIPPISQMDYLNKSLFTPAEYKSRA